MKLTKHQYPLRNLWPVAVLILFIMAPFATYNLYKKNKEQR